MLSHIEVFRTTVTRPADAARLLRQLAARWPGHRITFDLQDCDRVLRVESFSCPVDNAHVSEVIRQLGHRCEPLPD